MELLRKCALVALLVAATAGAPSCAFDDDGISQESAWLGGGTTKVDVCHIPPGNPDNAHTITVGEPAVQAHLNHGDFLGPCDAEPEPPDLDAGTGLPDAAPPVPF
jgi:hypothetical protein